MPRQLIDAFLGGNFDSPVLLSRRELLRRGTIAAGGLLSGICAGTRLNAHPSTGRRVIVIGAGFSGLACAFELAHAGYAVKVIEARNRVGGRVIGLKELVPGKTVEGGGEMIGSNHSHFLAYAARFGFEFREVDREAASSQIMLGGQTLAKTEIQSMSSEVEAAFSQMTNDARPVIAAEPWKTAQAEQLDQQSTAAWIDGLALSDLARKLLTLQLMADNGVVTAQQSYLGNLTQVKGGGLEKYWTDTEVYRLKEGNQQIAARFAKELGNGRVILNCAVREVSATAGGMSVLDAGGRTHEADDVVLAVPPSVWSTIKFSPGLPRELAPQMGSNLKYLSVVKSRFWRESQKSPNSRSDGNVCSTWEATAGQKDNGLFVLTAFSGGSAADANHRVPAPQRQPAYLKDLEALFPGFAVQFLKGQFMDWIGDPWTRAGYSFPAPGQVMTMGPLLQRGVGRLHFAGEHTCYQFVGYMEGALHSGASLARRLAQRDGVVSKP